MPLLISSIPEMSPGPYIEYYKELKPVAILVINAVYLCNKPLLHLTFQYLEDGEHRVVDIYTMGKDTRRNLVDAALQTEDQDHEDFLKKLKQRMDT